MYKIYNQSELKNKNMTPNTKTSFLTELKQFAIIIAVIMGIAFLLTISENKSELKPIQSVNVQAQSEKALTPEQEINKLKLQLDIKQKQTELENLSPKVQPQK